MDVEATGGLGRVWRNELTRNKGKINERNMPLKLLVSSRRHEDDLGKQDHRRNVWREVAVFSVINVPTKGPPGGSYIPGWLCWETAELLEVEPGRRPVNPGTGMPALLPPLLLPDHM